MLVTTEEVALNCSLTNAHVTVSHDGEYVIAHVLFEADSEQNDFQTVRTGDT